MHVKVPMQQAGYQQSGRLLDCHTDVLVVYVAPGVGDGGGLQGRFQ